MFSDTVTRTPSHRPDSESAITSLGESPALAGLFDALARVGALDGPDESIRYLAMLVEHSQSPIVVTDLSGNVTYWNAAAESAFGWSAEEVSGRHLADVVFREADAHHVAAGFDELRARGDFAGDVVCRRRDGSSFPARASIITMRNRDGEPVGFFGSANDISDLVRARRELRNHESLARAVLESIHSPAVVIDEEGIIARVNDAWSRMFVLAGGDPLFGGIGEIYSPERHSCSDATASAVISAGLRSVVTGDSDHFSHDYESASTGGRRRFRLEISPLDPTEAGAVLLHMDITGLSEAQQRAEMLAESRQRLISSVSHELRTPLTGVLGYAEIVDEDTPADEVREYLSIVAEQARDMSAILDDLLVVSKADAGPLLVTREPVDLSQSIASVARFLNGQAPPSMEIVGEGAQAIGDPVRVRQILRNLIVNAGRYGGGRVEIETGSENGTAWVAVRDDGSGPPAAAERAMFLPFQTFHAQPGRTEALGIGLYVARELAERMGGSLRYARSPDDWTEFTMTLPAEGCSTPS